VRTRVRAAPRAVGLFVADQMCTALFLLDLVINLRTGYLDVKARSVVMAPRQIACHYARTWLVLDSLATVPPSTVHTAPPVPPQPNLPRVPTDGMGTPCTAQVPFDLLARALGSRGTAAEAPTWIGRMQLVRLARVGRLPRILGRLEMRAGLQTTQSSATQFGLTSAL
jgi:hypothetical protein